MTESTDVSAQANKPVWDYIKDNPQMVGFPVSDTQGLDLLNALRDVYLEMEFNPKIAAEMLTMVVTVMVAAVAGQGNETIEEILVQEAMHRFDKDSKEVLNEG
jgi:hypothetical protein